MAEYTGGWTEEPEDLGGLVAATPPRVQQLAEAFLPAFDLSHDYPFPAYNQASANACIGMSVAEALNWELKFSGYNAEAVAGNFLWYNTRVLMNRENQNLGTNFTVGFRALQYWGFCLESSNPFNAKEFALKPSLNAYKEAIQRINIPYFKTDTTLDNIKMYIAARVPVVIGIRAFDSFVSQDASSTGIIPVPASGEQFRFGHSITIFGWDDSTQLLKFLNHWGNWGQNGWGYYPYSMLTPDYTGVTFWTLAGARL